jgi:hypothetical protein
MKVSYVVGHTTVELDDEMKSSITYTKDRVWVSQASPDEPKGYKRIRLTRELVKLIKEVDLR